MAQLDIYSVERRADKGADRARRRGPKPVRTALLWAQTAWLEARPRLDEGRVWFGDTAFDGALLHATVRALEKLEWREPQHEERARLDRRLQLWARWNECASLADLDSASWNARFVLESLLFEPLHPSPTRECADNPAVARCGGREDEWRALWPDETRELWRWLARNRCHPFWRDNSDFPVALAVRLDLSGASWPAFWNGPLAMSIVETGELLASIGDAPVVLGLAQFWAGARWHWPDVPPVGGNKLGADERAAFGWAWALLEREGKAQWLAFWRDIARHDQDAAALALQFHEVWLDSWQGEWAGGLLYKPGHLDAVLASLRARGGSVWDAITSLRQGSPDAGLWRFALEVWPRGAKDLDAELRTGLMRALPLARLAGIDIARQAHKTGNWKTLWVLGKHPDLLLLHCEWQRAVPELDLFWPLASLGERDAGCAGMLRRETKRLWEWAAREELLASPFLDTAFQELLERDEWPLQARFWRRAGELLPLLAPALRSWHPQMKWEVGRWLALWCELSLDMGWSREETASAWSGFLRNVEVCFAVREDKPGRAGWVSGSLEVSVRLAHAAGEALPQIEARIERLVERVAQSSKAEDEWGAARDSLKKRPVHARLAAALLRVGEKAPAFPAEFLAQIADFERLHLAGELVPIEAPFPLPQGELADFTDNFPALADEARELAGWMALAGEAERVPARAREEAGKAEAIGRELGFLRARLAQGDDEKLEKRRRALEERLQKDALPNEAELRNALCEATTVWIERALRGVVRGALQKRLRVVCGPLPEALAWNDDWANALLIACEIEQNRKWAAKLLRFAATGEANWREELPANARWLANFAVSGKDAGALLGPFSAQMGEWELWIERDPLLILQMGNRVGTCLSRGGCNSHSTVANALDLNKIVVYARRGGQIQARQLWVVMPDQTLAGCGLYTTLSRPARRHSRIGRAFLAFARRFAEVCGLALRSGDDLWEDVPELCGAGWYHDGFEAWDDLETSDEWRKPSRPVA